jgi:hypothetical protein
LPPLGYGTTLELTPPILPHHFRLGCGANHFQSDLCGWRGEQPVSQERNLL